MSAHLRNVLETLARRAYLSRDGLHFALTEAGILPRSAQWASFMNRALLVAGCLLLLAGVLFFFAYNWDELHRFAKISLILLPLLATALWAMQRGIDNLAGKALLSAATMLTGVLLAILGQIYQTGADTKWLFFGWAALVLPWVLCARLAWLWAFWLTLLNIAFVLDWRHWDFLYFGPHGPFVLLNACALLLWEVLSSRLHWMRGSHAARYLMLLLGTSCSMMGMVWWWHQTAVFAPFIYLLWLGVTLSFYRFYRRDIVPLALGGLSGIVVVTAGMVYAASKGNALGAGYFLLMGLVLIGLTGGLALWLRQVSAHWQAETSPSISHE